jgi:hypothetical protein
MLHALRVAPAAAAHSLRLLHARAVASARPRLSPAGRAGLPPRGAVRALASKRPEEEKSWGEIASEFVLFAFFFLFVFFARAGHVSPPTRQDPCPDEERTHAPPHASLFFFFARAGQLPTRLDPYPEKGKRELTHPPRTTSSKPNPLADDAATVLGGALTKLGKSALGALGGLLESGSSDTASSRRPPQRSSSPPPRRPRPGDEGDGDIFSWPGRSSGPLSQSGGGGGPLAGPLGGLIGGLLGRAVAGVAGALASQAAEASELRERALAALQSDAAVRDSFGGRPIALPGGPTSQAGSTAIINGRTTKRLTISFAVSGPRGQGVCQATSSVGDGGDGGGGSPTVSVRGPDGRVISVRGGDGGGGGWFGSGRRSGSFGRAGSGEVIDVDFKEL